MVMMERCSAGGGGVVGMMYLLLACVHEGMGRKRWRHDLVRTVLGALGKGETED